MRFDYVKRLAGVPLTGDPEEISDQDLLQAIANAAHWGLRFPEAGQAADAPGFDQSSATLRLGTIIGILMTRGIRPAPTCPPRAAEELVLERDGGGFRHYLNGRPVHAGTLLELWRNHEDGGGAWGQVRYECRLDRADADVRLYFHHDELGMTSRSHKRWQPGDRLRWPEKRGSS